MILAMLKQQLNLLAFGHANGKTLINDRKEIEAERVQFFLTERIC
jgi:hypothetical protein